MKIKIGEITAKARDDTGADFSVILRSFAEKILQADETIVKTVHDIPIGEKLAVQGSSVPSVKIVSESKTNLTLLLPGRNLPVLIYNVNLQVTDYDINVVLLGRGLLDSIGFNFQSYLKDNYGEIKNIDLNKRPAKLAAYKGVRSFSVWTSEL